MAPPVMVQSQADDFDGPSAASGLQIGTAPLDPAANQLTLPAIVVDAAPLRFELHYNAQAPLTLKTLQLTPATITLQKP